MSEDNDEIAELQPEYAVRRYRRGLRRLRSTLAKVPAQWGFVALWTLNRIRHDHEFVPPFHVSYPLEFLRSGPTSGIQNWELETIANEWLATTYEPNWLLENPFSWIYIGQIFHELREIENVAFTAEPQIEIEQELFRIMLKQEPFQLRVVRAVDFVRWHSILGGEVIDTAFKARVGTSVTNIMLLGGGVLAKASGEPLIDVTISLPHRKEDHSFYSFLQLISDHTFELKGAARGILATSDSFTYRRSVLREKPAMRIYGREGVKILVPIPQLLIWRITSGLYYDIIDIKGISNEIGKNFENYALRLLRKFFPEKHIASEFKYGLKRSRKDSPDILFYSDNGKIEGDYPLQTGTRISVLGF